MNLNALFDMERIELVQWSCLSGTDTVVRDGRTLYVSPELFAILRDDTKDAMKRKFRVVDLPRKQDIPVCIASFWEKAVLQLVNPNPPVKP